MKWIVSSSGFVCHVTDKQAKAHIKFYGYKLAGKRQIKREQARLKKARAEFAKEKAEAKKLLQQQQALSKSAHNDLDIVYVTQANYKDLLKFKGNPLFIAYKVSREHGRSPSYAGTKPVLICEAGNLLVVNNADTSKSDCAAGVNVATATWCKNEYGSSIQRAFDFTAGAGYGLMSPGYVWQVAFRKSDIAAVPPKSRGKFRLYRCRVLKQLNQSQYNAALERCRQPIPEVAKAA